MTAKSKLITRYKKYHDAELYSCADQHLIDTVDRMCTYQNSLTIPEQEYINQVIINYTCDKDINLSRYAILMCAHLRLNQAIPILEKIIAEEGDNITYALEAISLLNQPCKIRTNNL